ncbi:MAG: helix-turn-helix transcriptional regulator [Planctomycetota bacterium]|jgi:predicted DNA-binding transcriptional regulator AlpA
MAKIKHSEPLQIEPALLTILQVCQLLSISRAEFYRLNASGKFAPLPIGLCRKRLYLRSEVLDWLSAKCPHRKQWQIQRKEIKL